MELTNNPVVFMSYILRTQTFIIMKFWDYIQVSNQQLVFLRFKVHFIFRKFSP